LFAKVTSPFLFSLKDYQIPLCRMQEDIGLPLANLQKIWENINVLLVAD
jgi:hypothetical protein